MPAGGKPRRRFATFFLTRIFCTLCDHVCLVLVGVGGGRMFPFVCTCDARRVLRHVLWRVGGGDVNVRLHL